MKKSHCQIFYSMISGKSMCYSPHFCPSSYRSSSSVVALRQGTDSKIPHKSQVLPPLDYTLTENAAQHWKPPPVLYAHSGIPLVESKA
jgi:hypothetical protein